MKIFLCNFTSGKFDKFSITAKSDTNNFIFIQTHSDLRFVYIISHQKTFPCYYVHARNARIDFFQPF